jgi:hypothetical protein
MAGKGQSDPVLLLALFDAMVESAALMVVESMLTFWVVVVP